MTDAEARTSGLELACWGLVAPALAVDALNGLLVLQVGVDIKLSLLFKGLMVLALVLHLALRQPHLFLVAFVPFSAVIVARPAIELASGHIEALAFDVPVALRLLLLPLLLAFAVQTLRAAPQRFERIARGVLFLNYGLVAASVLIGLVGVGFPTYPSTGIGFKGFFVAGNELSAVLIVTSGFALFSVWRERSRSAYWALAIGNFVVAALLATKAAVLGALVLALAVPLVGCDRRRLAASTVTTVVAVIGLTGLVAWIARDAIASSALGQRVIFVYESVGLVDLIFSGRLEFISRYFDTIRDAGGLFELTFGFGSSNLLGSGPQSVEIDPIDVAIMSGIPIAMLLTFVAVASVLYPFARLRRHVFAPAAMIVNTLLLFFAVTAGHVWTSGMLAVSWMMLNGLALLQSSGVQSPPQPVSFTEGER